MEYVIWGIPPNKPTEELLMASSDGKPITDIMFARFCVDQLERVYNCSNVRIQTMDLTAGGNQLSIDAINV